MVPGNAPERATEKQGGLVASKGAQKPKDGRECSPGQSVGLAGQGIILIGRGAAGAAEASEWESGDPKLA